MKIHEKRGEWLNREDGVGYDLRQIRVERRWFRPPRSIYEFTLNPIHPLTWRTEDGYYQCDRHQEETDLGSIPPPIDRIWTRDQFLAAFCMHDQACRHGGLWHSLAAEEGPNGEIVGVFEFVEMPRSRIDQFIYRWVEAEPDLGGDRAKLPIYCGVRIGAAFGVGRRTE